MHRANATQSTDEPQRLWRRFLHEDAGQDIVEYAVIALFIGIVGWFVLFGIRDAAGDAYSSWIDPNSGTPSLWDPPEPPPGP